MITENVQLEGMLAQSPNANPSNFKSDAAQLSKDNYWDENDSWEE